MLLADAWAPAALAGAAGPADDAENIALIAQVIDASRCARHLPVDDPDCFAPPIRAFLHQVDVLAGAKKPQRLRRIQVRPKAARRSRKSRGAL